LDARCASVARIPLQRWRSLLQTARGLFSREPMQVWYYRYAAMQQAVDRLVAAHRPDVLYSHLFRTASYLLDHDTAPRVVGLQVAQTLNYRRLVAKTRQPLVKAFYALEYQKVKRYEPRLVPQFDRALLISPHDKAALDPTGRFDNVFFNPHGIQAHYYGEAPAADGTAAPPAPHAIVMNADFEAPTNVDAALHFYHDIFPAVRRAVPEAELWLAGRRPARAIRRLAGDPAVTVTGFVEDLRPYLHRAAVAIDPLRIGAGLQNKILVDMAAGLPVVATPIANEGIQIPEGEAIVIADGPDAFARAVVRLLRDPDARARLGAAAQAFVRRYWTWDYHFAQFEGMLRRLLTDGPGALVQQYYPFRLDDGAGPAPTAADADANADARPAAPVAPPAP
jgi:glycosyltransferase involved in cell wall biosynthesis